jgi:SAM-dependent methyltransferase
LVGTAERLAELRPYADRARTFSGWDHSMVRVKALDGGLPWDYEALARVRASEAGRVIDLGTGGGERYAAIAQGLGGTFIASEAWGVNARIAYERLRGQGIATVWAESERPPFADGAFDLVLSRHEAIVPMEVDRILAPGGRFITQQVMPNHWPELRAHFPRQAIFEPHDETYPAAFRALGYRVSMHTHECEVAFETLGDLVFMLITAPWEIPGFDIEADIDALLAVERDCLAPAGIVLSEGRYLLEACKPG